MNSATKGLRFIEEALARLLTATTPKAIAPGENLLLYVKKHGYGDTMTHAVVMHALARLLVKVERNPQREVELLEHACDIYEENKEDQHDWLVAYFDMSSMLCRCYYNLREYGRLHKRAVKILQLPALADHVSAPTLAYFWDFMAQFYEYLRSYALATACAELAMQVYAVRDAHLEKMQANLNRLYEAADQPRALWTPCGSDCRMCGGCGAVLNVSDLLNGQSYEVCDECDNAIFCSRECARDHGEWCGQTTLIPRRINIHARSKCVTCFRVQATQCCAKCRGPRYCGETCQRSDWANHRSKCGK